MKTEQEIKEEYHRVYLKIQEGVKTSKASGYQRSKLLSRYETLHWILFDMSEIN